MTLIETVPSKMEKIAENEKLVFRIGISTGLLSFFGPYILSVLNADWAWRAPNWQEAFFALLCFLIPFWLANYVNFRALKMRIANNEALLVGNHNNEMCKSNDVRELEKKYLVSENKRSEAEDRLRDLAGRDIETRAVFDLSISNFSNFLNYAPVYIADAAGFFQSERIKVKFDNRGNDEEAVAAVLRGDVHAAIADPLAVCGIDDHQNELVFLMPIVKKAAVWICLHDKYDGDFKKLQNSKEPVNFLTFSKGSTAYNLAEHLRQDILRKNSNAKITTKAATIELGCDTPNPFANYIGKIDQMIDREQPDAFFLSQPETQVFAKKNSYQKFIPCQIQKHFSSGAGDDSDFAFTCLIAKRSRVNKRPEEFRRLIKGIRLGLMYVHSLPALPPQSWMDSAPNKRNVDKKIWDNEALPKYDKSDRWKFAVTAIKEATQKCYPNNFATEYDLVEILEFMRMKQFFASGDPYLGRLTGALLNAINHSNNEDITADDFVPRVYDVRERLNIREMI